jgi:hypothetical protein
VISRGNHCTVFFNREVVIEGADVFRPSASLLSIAFAVNNSPKLFKLPETTRFNHPNAYKAAAKPLTSTNK